MQLKVGILTFHYTTNYGAVLQAYALKKYISMLGYDVSIIDYRSTAEKSAMQVYRVRDFRNPINIIKYLIRKKTHIEKIDTFKQFIAQELCVDSHIINNLTETQGTYDTIVCGSDQIWNRYITGEDNTYLLDFDDSCKRVSYAASIGASAYNEKHCKIISDHLKNFYAVSVREAESRTKLLEYGINATVCCDPTLLFDKKEWSGLAKQPTILLNKFLFAYELEVNPEMRLHAEAIAKEKGLEVIYLIANSLETPANKGTVRYLNRCTPQEFLWYMSNSEYVVTNSFHGTIFSINFEKNFQSFLLKNQANVNNRITNVLSQFHLTNRLFQNEATCGDIDYTSISVEVQHDREKGKQFLKDSLLYEK